MSRGSRARRGGGETGGTESGSTGSESALLRRFTAREAPVNDTDDANAGLLTRIVRARTLGPEAMESLRRDVARDSRIGIGYLGVGAIVAAILLSVRGLGVFILNFTTYQNPWLTLLGWVIVAITITGCCLLAQSRGSRLPTPVFGAALALLVVAVQLDLVSTGGFVVGGPEVSVIVGAGATLLALVAYRPLNQLILCTLLLAAWLLTVTIIGVLEAPSAASPQIEVIVAALAPALIAILIVKSFTRFIDRELDRTLVESTLASPRFVVGISGSDELARLDQRAEELLSDVASGRAALPLDPTQAAAASALASDLRLRLIAGRRQTWLQHAIEDSEVLSPTVTLFDAAGLAGYLEREQREGLLSAIWLIAASATRQLPAITVTIGPQRDDTAHNRTDMIAFPIDISIEGIPRRRIDVTIWGALDRVGQHSESGRQGSIRIVVDVSVETPET